MNEKMHAALVRMQQMKEENCTITSEDFVRSLLPERPRNAHKGDFGRVLILAGSVGYTGAPALAANAALRMGAGLIFDGRLARGANGNAGEVGHVRLAPYGPTGYGKLGSFEGFCSGGGVAQVAVTLGKQAVQSGVTPAYYTGSWDDVTTKSVAMAARAGDKTALAVFDLVGEKLGEGLSILTDIVNPEVIVIGSVFARCENLLRPAMERVMRRECLSASFAAVRVVPARLGESIGDCAALCVAEYGLAAAHDK